MNGDRDTHLKALSEMVEAAYEEQGISYTVQRDTPKRGKELVVTLTFSEQRSEEAFNRVCSLLRDI